MSTVIEPNPRRDNMGRFSVEVHIANYSDVIQARLGVIRPEQIRRTRVSGVVDTGATRMVLPVTVVQQLGLPETGEASVKYADGRRAQKKTVGDVHLTYLGRGGVFSAVVEPGRPDALIGAIVLEELDLIPDCATQRLVPRDPNGILTEIE